MVSAIRCLHFSNLTAFPNPIYRQRYLEAGTDYFLDQTIDVNRLIEVITSLARDKLHLNNNYLDEASKGQGELEL